MCMCAVSWLVVYLLWECSCVELAAKLHKTPYIAFLCCSAAGSLCPRPGAWNFLVECVGSDGRQCILVFPSGSESRVPRISRINILKRLDCGTENH